MELPGNVLGYAGIAEPDMTLFMPEYNEPEAALLPGICCPVRVEELSRPVFPSAVLRSVQKLEPDVDAASTPGTPV